MDLYLRKVRDTKDKYRVVIKRDETEFEIGSIGLSFQAGPDPVWMWGIDTVLPMREEQSSGTGSDRLDCQRQFKAAWESYTADAGWLAEFLAMKRKRM
jgi:hypothetical protein